MISHQYLRVKISNKGNNISPVFCTPDKDLLLFSNLIKEYDLAARERKSKGLLTDRIRIIETACGDARLVKGICSLLDRRCKFVNTLEQKKNTSGLKQEIPEVDSKILRRNLFEESAKRELALSTDKRNQIVQSIASRLGIDHDSLQKLIWNDLDENYRLQSFSGLQPTDLVAWYNLAVVQSLLFSCNNLEFSLVGGANWKAVLRNVKRYGLMYSIRAQKSANHGKSLDDKIFCSVDGPLSILKMTELYGTALAKLVPSILHSEDWSMKAWIVRKSEGLGKRVYDFQLNKNIAPIMSLPFRYSDPSNPAGTVSVFDSGYEKKFATKFERCRTDWTIRREPDPIILEDGKVFIPDFLFERQGHKIYLEIIGFWTLDYLKRKMNKLLRIPSGQENHDSISCDLFVAVNKEYLTNSAYQDAQPELQKLRLLLQNDHLILYEKGEVPLKQILSYLKILNKDLVVRLADAFSKEILVEVNRLIGRDGDKANCEKCPNGMISLADLAARFNVPVETVHVALQRGKAGNLFQDSSYHILGQYLISKDKCAELQTYLLNANTLSDACVILDKLEIPQICQIDLLSGLGYDVTWRGIDVNNATIKKHHEKAASHNL